jgi:hypothetical protein
VISTCAVTTSSWRDCAKCSSWLSAVEPRKWSSVSRKSKNSPARRLERALVARLAQRQRVVRHHDDARLGGVERRVGRQPLRARQRLRRRHHDRLEAVAHGKAGRLADALEQRAHFVFGGRHQPRHDDAQRRWRSDRGGASPAAGGGGSARGRPRGALGELDPLALRRVGRVRQRRRRDAAEQNAARARAPSRAARAGTCTAAPTCGRAAPECRRRATPAAARAGARTPSQCRASSR